jgi:hypothetical protein
MTVPAAGVVVGADPSGGPVIELVGPVVPGGRGPCAMGRAAEGPGSRPDNTGVGQAPGGGGAMEPGGASPMVRIG